MAADRTGTARRLFALNAVSAWAGWGLIQVINVFDLVPANAERPVPANLVGHSEPGLAGAVGRMFDSVSYFTHWSNLLVAITVTMLVIDPARRGPVFRLFRNTGLLMITMTFVLYNLLLASIANPQGLHVVTNLLEHYVTPLLTIAVWVVAGPRGLYAFADTFRVFLVPLVYLAYTLTRGAAAGVYPYPFFNVVAYGYPAVLTLMAEVLVAGWLVACLFLLLERLRALRSDGPVPVRASE